LDNLELHPALFIFSISDNCLLLNTFNNFAVAHFTIFEPIAFQAANQNNQLITFQVGVLLSAGQIHAVQAIHHNIAVGDVAVDIAIFLREFQNSFFVIQCIKEFAIRISLFKFQIEGAQYFSAICSIDSFNQCLKLFNSCANC
jgi:hypothetical protein